jgi:hypothetical protein
MQYHVFDLDGVLLDSKGDYREQSLVGENLNIDLLARCSHEFPRHLSRNRMIVNGCVITGRDRKQQFLLERLFRSRGCVITGGIVCREFIADLDTANELFMPMYHRWKVYAILRVYMHVNRAELVKKHEMLGLNYARVTPESPYMQEATFLSQYGTTHFTANVVVHEDDERVCQLVRELGIRVVQYKDCVEV